MIARLKAAIGFMMLAMVIGGCGNGNSASEPSGSAQAPTQAHTQTNPPTQAEAKAPPAREPVTLKWASNPAHISEENFKRFISEPTRKKYPNITLEFINLANVKGGEATLVASGEIPDIITNYPLNLNNEVALGLTSSIEDLIKQNKFDVNRIQPEFLKAIKTGSFKSELVGLPINNNAFALMYNKELFDRFAVPYPKDGMTWEQVRDLAGRMTRNTEGTQYFGLSADVVSRGAMQMALPYIDLEHDSAVFQSQGWKDIFELWSSLFHAQTASYVPGLEFNFSKDMPSFYSGKIAMTSVFTNMMSDVYGVKDLDWRLVTYPTNSKAPGFGFRVDALVAMVTAQSKHRDDAFQVIAVALSDEVQTAMSQGGIVSVLNNKEIQQQFGVNSVQDASRNMVAFTKLKYGDIQPLKYQFSKNPVGIINGKFMDVMKGKDINTALREADEEMTGLIKEAKSAK